MKTTLLAIVVLAVTAIALANDGQRLVWPLPPDEPRIEYLAEIDCNDLSPKGGIFGKVKRLLAGNAPSDKLELPFDLVISGNSMFLTCQNQPALAELNLESNSFKLHNDDDFPFAYPISLTDGGDGMIFVTDSENGCVYRYKDGKVRRFIGEGLMRPTGIVALPTKKRIFVVDTGNHSVKMFDYDGRLLRTLRVGAEAESGLHYPTFATATADGYVLVNDALNYRILRFDSEGEFVSAFGSEGDGPGTFSRPKGIATDSDAHIYVVDNLFDNLQIFDESGRVLLAFGTGGQSSGQFWSPCGIDIVGDTLYVADTFNNRIQIFRYLGESE